MLLFVFLSFKVLQCSTHGSVCPLESDVHSQAGVDQREDGHPASAGWNWTSIQLLRKNFHFGFNDTRVKETIFMLLIIPWMK